MHPEVLRSARWRASRDGLDGELVDLEDAGEWDEVSALVAQTLARGNGARRQREVVERTGSLVELVGWIASETSVAAPPWRTRPA